MKQTMASNTNNDNDNNTSTSTSTINQWSCSSCTFINNNSTSTTNSTSTSSSSRERCSMCHAQRPRMLALQQLSPKPNPNPKRPSPSTTQTSLIDLTVMSDDDDDDNGDDDHDHDDTSNGNGNHNRMDVALASTESARKRKRRRNHDRDNDNDNGNNNNGDDNTNCNNNDDSNEAGRTIAASRIRTRPRPRPRANKENVKVRSHGHEFQHEHEHEKTVRVARKGRGMRNHDRNEENAKVMLKSTDKSISKSNSNHNNNNNDNNGKSQKTMVQSTLFGSIVRNIRETDVSKLSNAPEKKSREGNANSKSKSTSTSASASNSTKDVQDYLNSPMDMEDVRPKQRNRKENTNMNTNTYINANTNTIKSTKYNATASTSTSTSTSTYNHKYNYETLHAQAMKNLSTKFSIPPQSLRSLQPIAIRSALQQKSQIIIMATGGGKSLCYQLPATVLRGVTIVVSPLIALMVDQVMGLKKRGIEAVLMSGSLGEKEKKGILQRLVGASDHDSISSSISISGSSSNSNSIKVKAKTNSSSSSNSSSKPIKLLYCTPELIKTTRFRAVLTNLHKRNLLSMIAVDEAHCLSTWGHDFRPAYRQLSWLRHSFPTVPCMACTATATPRVIEDIKEILCFRNGEECHMSTFNRPNVSYEVRYKDSMVMGTGGDDAALKDLIRTIQREHRKANVEGVPCSGIVYVHKRDDTTMITKKLQKAGISAAPYHAGLKDADRKRTQQEWTNGKINVAIATVAFGMGIDLAHVRYVLHWSMSKTVEGFYQESGRAGRDGLPSKSILYYSKDDASKFAFLIRKNSERNEAKGKKTSGDERSLEALNKMVEFCTSSCCRRAFLLKHFGEDIDPQVICKKTCDYCIDPKKVESALNKSSVSRAVRDIKNQRFRYNKEAKLDGAFNHGIESDDDGEHDYYPSTSDSGLGITCNPSASGDLGFTTGGGKPLKGFKSAKSVLSKYQAMEYRSSLGTKNGGFVHFKAKPRQRVRDLHVDDDDRKDTSESKKSTSVSVPSHLMQQIQAKASQSSSTTPVVKAKNSKDLSLDADRVRAELEEIRKRKEKLLAKFRKK